MKTGQVRVCKECGNHNPADSWSCVKCGATLSVDTVRTQEFSPSWQASEKQGDSPLANDVAAEASPADGEKFCTQCGIRNTATSRFCRQCGAQLPGINASIPLPGRPQTIYPIVPSDPVSQVATIAGISNMVGGALTVLGWLLPWISIGGLVGTFLSWLNLGSRSGLLNLRSGIGSGLQISLFSLLTSFAAFGLATDEGGFALFGLILLFVAGALFSIPILAVGIFRSGMRIFETRTYSPEQAESRPNSIRDMLQSTRSESIKILVILTTIFILAALIPFGTSVLGGGYYLTAIGAVIAYAGVYFSQSRLRQILR